MDISDHLIDNLMEWERKSESANLEKHQQFLQEAQLRVCDNPLEATAWENGFVPDSRDTPSDQLEFRIQASLQPLAFMVSRPRQPTTTGEELIRRFDAGVRPYCYETGSQDSEDIPRCVSIKSMERQDGSFLLLMFDHGRHRRPISRSSFRPPRRL